MKVKKQHWCTTKNVRRHQCPGPSPPSSLSCPFALTTVSSLGEALFWSKTLIIWVCPCWAAWCKGVYPFCGKKVEETTHSLGHKVDDFGGRRGERCLPSFWHRLLQNAGAGNWLSWCFRSGSPHVAVCIPSVIMFFFFLKKHHKYTFSNSYNSYPK